MNNKEGLYNRVSHQWQKFLRATGKMDTKERNTILRRIVENKSIGTFSPTEVLEWVAEEGLSTATVYNTLNLLVEARILHRLRQSVNSTKMMYEFAHGGTNHMQIICTRCGRVSNVRDSAIHHNIQSKLYQNFKLGHYSLYIYGVCEKCNKK